MVGASTKLDGTIKIGELERAIQDRLSQLRMPVIARDWTNGTGTHTSIHCTALDCERFFQDPDLMHKEGQPYLGEVDVDVYVQLVRLGHGGIVFDTKYVKRIK